MAAGTKSKVKSNQSDTVGYSPQKHGNLAQWVALAIVLLLGIVNLLVTLYFRNADSAARTSDEHVNSLIDAKMEKINSHIDVKMDAIGGKIDLLSDRVSRLEGARIIADVPALRKRFNQAIAEAKSALDTEKPGDPKNIHQQIQTIASTLVNVKMPADLLNQGVSALVHVAAYGYFTQAFPSHPPDLVMRDVKFHNNGGDAIFLDHDSSVIVDGGSVVDSQQDLSNIYWIHTTFENSVIRYNGGPLYLADVTFKNCTFKFGADSRSQQVKAALLGVTKRKKPATMLMAANFSSLGLHPGKNSN